MATKSNPFEAQTTDTLEGRLIRERKADELDGKRVHRRLVRPAQIALKTTEVKKQQFARLAELMNRSMIETFELALDVLEEKLKAELKSSRK